MVMYIVRKKIYHRPNPMRTRIETQIGNGAYTLFYRTTEVMWIQKNKWIIIEICGRKPIVETFDQTSLHAIVSIVYQICNKARNLWVTGRKISWRSILIQCPKSNSKATREWKSKRESCSIRLKWVSWSFSINDEARTNLVIIWLKFGGVPVYPFLHLLTRTSME